MSEIVGSVYCWYMVPTPLRADSYYICIYIRERITKTSIINGCVRLEGEGGDWHPDFYKMGHSERNFFEVLPKAWTNPPPLSSEKKWFDPKKICLLLQVVELLRARYPLPLYRL